MLIFTPHSFAARASLQMRTYLLQWLAYYSLNGTVLAVLLTLVCVSFKLMPMSNGGLIFASNYLGLVQLYAMLILGEFFPSICIRVFRIKRTARDIY